MPIYPRCLYITLNGVSLTAKKLAAIAILVFATNIFMTWKAVASDLPISMDLPPSEDIPEEIARTEIITEARSSLDGSPITAVEYAEQQTSLRTAPYPPDAPQKFRDLVLLLQFRRLLRPFLP